MLVLYYTVRPTVSYFVSKTKDGEEIDEILLQAILMSVMVFGILADWIGIHAVFGAFVVGVVIPNGPVVAVLMERMDDFVTGFFLPLFFVVVGVKVDLRTLDTPQIYVFLIIIILVVSGVKIGAMVVSTTFFGFPTHIGLSLGILMNTKGIMELIVLYIAFDKKV